LQEKIRKLDLLGIDRLVVIPFNHEFASQSAEEFLRDILVGTIGLKHLVVGYNHSFGKDREGNIEFLKERATEYNYTLDVVDAHEISGIAISSTKIRHALQEGNLNVANGYLGTPYRLAGTVVSGNGRGKTLGYPTANIQPEDADQLIPAQGVYAVNVRIGDEIFPGVGSIGYAETFSSDNPLMIEVHIFDFERDLYGIRLKVDWVEFIRKQVKFGGKEELVIAMNEDEKKARRILSGNV
jgi:riboflavin kinase/FMN adenylyltransferase